MPQESPGSRVRWKLLLWLEGILLVLWFVLKSIPAFADSGVAGVTDLLFVVLVVVIFAGWLLLASGLPWKVRWLAVAAVAVLPALVKMDGHTGSYFPQFSWRWTTDPAREMPELTGKMAGQGTPLETEGPRHFPRFLGAGMNNRVSGELLPDQWYERDPTELWRRPIGEGWSAFSVAGGYAFTLEQRGARELTICYELQTGEPVWLHQEEVRFEESMGDDGPRSTPTLVDNKVLSLGATGILNCLDARTGKLIWGKDILAEAGHEVPQWAKSCSPLVVDGKVVVTLGSKADQNLAAYDLTSGDLVWRSGDYPTSYASPVVAELAGIRQIVALQQESVDGYDIETGEILWSFPIGNSQSNCASPMIAGDSVLTSGGYGYGTHRIQIKETPEGLVAEELWHTRKLKAKFADFLVHKDHVYGLNEGRLVCLNLADGGMAWRGHNYGHGQLLGIGDHAVIQHERGLVSVIALNPEEETVVNEFEALDHRTWNHPVLAGTILLLRNDREAVALKWQ